MSRIYRCLHLFIAAVKLNKPQTLQTSLDFELWYSDWYQGSRDLEFPMILLDFQTQIQMLT
jgi:hypothetical protein